MVRLDAASNASLNWKLLSSSLLFFVLFVRFRMLILSSDKYHPKHADRRAFEGPDCLGKEWVREVSIGCHERDDRVAADGQIV